MGMSARAHLAYGYDLGTGEDFNAAERGEYGEPKLPWMPVDESGDSDYEDFGGEVGKRLLASVGFTETNWRAEGYYDREYEAQKRVGVELDYSGHSDYAGWVLIAAGSERSVTWSEVIALDVDELKFEDRLPGWSKRLADALAALGITPTQTAPKWLVYPSYG
jgi:hypothetical protein